uniref:Uncharacterized protein n=1 Tax=Anguilla anguilla TaxID=7936 RepID=A0A0E9UCH8_ANGAN
MQCKAEVSTQISCHKFNLTASTKSDHRSSIFILFSAAFRHLPAL